MPQQRPTRRVPPGISALLLVVTVLTLLGLYIGCYYKLSRRGMDQSRFANSIHGGDPERWRDNWSYVTHDEIQADLDAGVTTNIDRNRRRYWFFRPAAWIDERLFGGAPAWKPR
jgi:hypothetical protein